MTWARVASFEADQVTLVTIDAREGETSSGGGTIWVGTAGADAGLWRSTDDGATWGEGYGTCRGVYPASCGF
ncbi:MAG: hypothetical protein J6386_13840 [Candidatus Synoicihabitans palmerolidicus]|nr:hypothetical protein [Candidatus Synoicihabitans palmerolidicus]